jgi:hypothetical protein
MYTVHAFTSDTDFVLLYEGDFLVIGAAVARNAAEILLHRQPRYRNVELRDKAGQLLGEWEATPDIELCR